MPLFQRQIITRGYEPDCTATIPACRILNYLEQLRWEFIRDPESGLQEHLASGHFPVMRAQRIEMLQRVGMDTPLGNEQTVGASTIAFTASSFACSKPTWD